MGADTDFQRSIERTGYVQNHHIAFGGGSDQASYRASIGMMSHNTVIRTNDYRNYTAKLDLMQQAFDKHLTVELGVFGSLQKDNDLPFQQKLIYSAQAFNDQQQRRQWQSWYRRQEHSARLSQLCPRPQCKILISSSMIQLKHFTYCIIGCALGSTVTACSLDENPRDQIP